MSYTLYIKNMVCPRCIKVVEQSLAGCGLQPLSVVLGQADLPVRPSGETLEQVRRLLESEGFELIDSPRVRLVEAVKSAVITYVRRTDEDRKVNLSGYLSDALHRDYSSLSKLFSEETGVTIERYAIAQRVEYVKELLSYGELTLNEIADFLGYSSSAYLSAQFKSVTGVTPGQFRKGLLPRKPLDGV